MKSHLRFSAFAALVFVAVSLTIRGGELPPSRSVLDKTRMSTHIVMGTATAIKVIDEATGKVIANPHSDLEVGQRFQVEIQVNEVLLADGNFQIQATDHLKIRFGRKRLTLSVYRDGLIGKPLIYWLSRDSEHAARSNYFFPFYGDENLVCLPDQLETVKAAIVRIKDAIK